jgi:hypothetical protein
MMFTDKEYITLRFRESFLKWIDKLAPEVMDELKAIAPTYKQVFGEFNENKSKGVYDSIVSTALTDSNVLLILSKFEPSYRLLETGAPILNEDENKKVNDFIDFRKSFNDFIDRFALNAEWLKAHIFDLLYNLTNRPESHHDFSSYNAGYIPFDSGQFIFEYKSWDITKNSKVFERFALLNFEKYLKNYINKAVDEARKKGYKLNRNGRNSAKFNLNRVKWLVRFSVQNRTMQQVWNEYDKPKNNTLKAFSNFERKVYLSFNEFRKYDLPIRAKKHTESK